jgi:hypothetical protein
MTRREKGWTRERESQEGYGVVLDEIWFLAHILAGIQNAVSRGSENEASTHVSKMAILHEWMYHE